MGAVFDAQFLNMKNSFAREGIEINVSYTPAGDVHYIYEVGHLLAVDSGDNQMPAFIIQSQRVWAWPNNAERIQDQDGDVRTLNNRISELAQPRFAFDQQYAYAELHTEFRF